MDMHDILIAKKLAGGGGSEPTLVEKTVTENGTYLASADSADGFSQVVVNVRSIDEIPISSATGSYQFSSLGLSWDNNAVEVTE